MVKLLFATTGQMVVFAVCEHTVPVQMSFVQMLKSLQSAGMQPAGGSHTPVAVLQV
jgi:hypothetical protein